MSVLPQHSDFIFTEKLGEGSFATVYKAYRKGSRRDVVAIKCVQKSSLNKVSVENLISEITILKAIKHEHIVEMKDFVWDSRYIYLILEFCSGGDLSRFIHRKRRLPEADVQRFLQQLVSALQVLHSKNIAHMDLKPQNILLSSSQNPVLKIGDFGLAQYLEKDGSSLRGSPLYMAPEILLKRQYDSRVDLWSVGIIMYECLFGQAPFSSDTYARLAEKIKSVKPIQLPVGAKVSDNCRDLLHRLLQRDPDKRITFDELFRHPFVDLEHMATPESYIKGRNLMVQACESDKKGNFPEAVELYSKALEYLVPHVQKESNRSKRELLRNELFEHMNRVEELKRLTQFTNSSINYITKVDNTFPELGRLLYNDSHLQSAVRLALEADELVLRNNLEEALDLYTQALEVMVPATRNSQSGPVREAMVQEVDRWLTKAEKLKAFISGRGTNQKVQIPKDIGNSSVQYNPANESLGCTIQ